MGKDVSRSIPFPKSENVDFMSPTSPTWYLVTISNFYNSSHLNFILTVLALLENCPTLHYYFTFESYNYVTYGTQLLGCIIISPTRELYVVYGQKLSYTFNHVHKPRPFF